MPTKTNMPKGMKRETSETKPAAQIRSKTDQRYWLDRVTRRTRSSSDTEVKEADFSAQISYCGRRERIRLATSNKAEAATRAAAFYRSLISGGWDSAYETHAFAKAGQRRRSAPSSTAPPDSPGNTLKDLFTAYETVATPRKSTLASYKKAIRKIYSDVAQVNGTNRFKTAGTGNRAWKGAVDQLPLSTVTADILLEWKRRQLGDGNGTLDEKRARAITLNSLLRNARSLFAKRHRKQLAKLVTLPEPIPFDEVSPESAPPPRYRSRIDARAILRSADSELRSFKPAVYAALNLALRSGLRRREIDTLMWASVDLERKVVHVEANEVYDLKSHDSAGEVDISDELAEFLTDFRKANRTEMFVIPTPTKVRVRKPRSPADKPIAETTSTPESYRCTMIFKELIAWLRSHGVSSKRPIHELRKEVAP
jgi:integrase